LQRAHNTGRNPKNRFNVTVEFHSLCCATLIMAGLSVLESLRSPA
jgi:hypothetical protein